MDYLRHSIKKAIEEPTAKPFKERHIRMTIAGSIQEKGGDTFWSTLVNIRIYSDIMVIWRFCYVFHRLLEEGHPNFITESQHYKPWIASLGLSWAQGISYFGNTVAQYSSLLTKRLEFHAKYPQFSGDLKIDEEAITQIIVYKDVNYILQITEDIMDNVDEILKLQTKVMVTLANPEDQIQLSALVLCITDSVNFDVVLLRVIEKLHANKSASPAKYIEYIERFNIQYQGLAKFYTLAKTYPFIEQKIVVPSSPPKLELKFSIESNRIRPDENTSLPKPDNSNSAEANANQYI